MIPAQDFHMEQFFFVTLLNQQNFILSFGSREDDYGVADRANEFHAGHALRPR